jgi:hypothetical protein
MVTLENVLILAFILFCLLGLGLTLIFYALGVAAKEESEFMADDY